MLIVGLFVMMPIGLLKETFVRLMEYYSKKRSKKHFAKSNCRMAGETKWRIKVMAGAL